jgi:hypothetical protein
MSSTNRVAKRVALDYYATPEWCTELLLDELATLSDGPGEVYDPFAGDGAILRVASRIQARRVMDHHQSAFFAVRRRNQSMPRQSDAFRDAPSLELPWWTEAKQVLARLCTEQALRVVEAAKLCERQNGLVRICLVYLEWQMGR